MKEKIWDNLKLYLKEQLQLNHLNLWLVKMIKNDSRKILKKNKQLNVNYVKKIFQSSKESIDAKDVSGI